MSKHKALGRMDWKDRNIIMHALTLAIDYEESTLDAHRRETFKVVGSRMVPLVRYMKGSSKIVKQTQKNIQRFNRVLEMLRSET